MHLTLNGPKWRQIFKLLSKYFPQLQYLHLGLVVIMGLNKTKIDIIGLFVNTYILCYNFMN
jgi:hypothetical protein